ncbi:CBS domain-containing protein/DUF21 domain-containing protein [Cephalotus follicularis]|uniref:CBS domain-containing protein/DUF21 domain-containing protein n=1 Tax=Cephalotus follicularis TaxID=3775 RepID=A0A1Q3C871_CEPFO|nr:CBS domain-containing protein/DUF21 domain-containing protein [Cephalotus follicularis]
MAANDVPPSELMFWVYLTISVLLVCFAGLMSGLTLGLMSLSLVDLEVLIKAGQPQDRKNAEKILPIVKNQHLLLCTLLIGNSLAMEALPIFLDSLLPAWGAILISVTLILAFGEIIPQAVCSRYGLSVGAKLSPVVRLIVFILFPIAYPISKLLDWILGERHSALLRRAELKMFVDMHGNEAGKGGELTQDETTIINGALDMSQKTAKDAMTPLSKIFSLDIDSKLDENAVGLIISKGHSRVPIYSGTKNNIVGLLLVKNLIKYRQEDETPIRDLNIRKIPRIHECLPLYDILNQFQTGHSHMAVVVKETAKNSKSKSITVETNTNPQIQHKKLGMTGTDHHRYGRNENVNISVNSASVNTCDTENNSPDTKHFKELNNHLHPQSMKWEQRDRSIKTGELESLSNLDEEVIGIITLEDVMEELLQEEILDETDEYVEMHNKIKINMQLAKRSPRRSPGATSASHVLWRSPVASPLSSSYQTPFSSCHQSPVQHSPISPYIQSQLVRPTLSASTGAAALPSHLHRGTPVASPLSSCHQTPTLRSPVLPYIQSLFARPTLCASPGKPMQNPSPFAGAARCSPSSHQVSRKSYEKLRRPDG